LEERKENSVLIKITVTDQGVGISPIEQRHLFNAFTQLDNSKTRKHSGAGLGLAISKSLATAMNGDIGVDSHLNEGSTFWFTFECKLDDEKSSFVEPPKQFAKQCAYVYDSNELSRLSISHSLEDLGFSVDEFSHIPDLTHQMSESRECQLCVLGLTRLEAQHSNDFKQLISLPAYQAIKSLFLINSADPSTLLRMREYGADACLSKPWKKTELSHTLTSLLITGTEAETGSQAPTAPFVDNSPSNAEYHLNNLEILIAEDNAINAKLLETVLQQAGAKTKHVNSGNQAIDEFTTGNYNIILMDIHMPEVNGIEATRVIRFKEDGKSHIPILGLTANILDEDRKLCFSSGMNEVLIKPIAVEELLHEIDYWTHWRTKTSAQQETHSSRITTRPPSDNVRDVQQLGVNPELEYTLYKMLVDELPAFRKQLHQYFEQKDWASLREACHKLLGGTSYCNVNELRNAVKQFQESLKREADDLPAAFQTLLAEIDRLTNKH
jgi:two-component system sensor histidine kinase BarA